MNADGHGPPRRGPRFGGARAAALCAALAGCAPPPVPEAGPGPTGAGRAPVAVDRATCGPDAVLLAEGVSVLAAPVPGAEAVRPLPRRTPVYLCGAAGGYRGVMFPAPGERAVCGGRGGGGACPTGWVREPVPIEVAG
jgi:hypothetical protein